MPSPNVSPSPQSDPRAACRRAALRSIASHPAAGAGHEPQRPAPSREPHGLLRLSRKFAAWLCCCLVLVLLAAGLAVLSAAPGLAADPEDEDGDLRLTRGGDKGRLQVYYNGRWGGVCDDGFGWEEADVACRQLEYPGADRYGSRTDWSLSLPIWLDDVVCVGTEERLADCSHTAWGGHNCSPQEHVWVQCTVTTATSAVLLHPMIIEMDEDSTATYEVWLDTAPTDDVTVTVAGHSGTDLTVQPASLTFTTENWNSRQTVTVSAAADIDVGDDDDELMHSASGGGYGSVEIPDVEVTVVDRGVVRVVVDPRVVTVDEGDTGSSYTVVLSGGQPTDDVTVMVETPDGTDVSVQPASLTFKTENWNSRQTVTVTAAEDDDKDSDTVTLTHSASGGGYDEERTVRSVEVRVQDNDIEVEASPAALTVKEDGTATYELRTVGGPWDSLTVAVEPPADSGFERAPSI